MDKIAVIIVHYNTNQDTWACLDSLAQLTPNSAFEVQVFVVDNASKDAFYLLKKNKNVTIVRSDTNLGFTGGNNLGFNYARKNYNPDYYLLLNSDTLVEKDFLTLLYSQLKADHKLGLVSPKIYFAPGCEFHRQSYKKSEQGKVIWFAGGIIDWDNLLTFHAGVDEVDRGQFDQLTDFDYASGCCFLVRREALAVSGVFDDRYFLYFEDCDLSLRIERSGWKLGFCPQAIVWHKNGSSTDGAGSELQQFYLTRNRLLFFATYGYLSVKIRTWRLAWRLWRHGNRVEKKAAQKFLTRQFGKEVII